jgi:hypothetical protein
MHSLGAEMDKSSKCFYTDKHEDPTVIAYRRVYCKKWLKREKRMFTWVKMAPEIHDALKSRSKNPEMFPSGESITMDGKDAIIHHVDEADFFDDQKRFPRILHPHWTTLKAVPGIPLLFSHPHFNSLFVPSSRSQFFNLFIATRIFCAFRL